MRAEETETTRHSLISRPQACALLKSAALLARMNAPVGFHGGRLTLRRAYG
jgi:hypothetical protein